MICLGDRLELEAWPNERAVLVFLKLRVPALVARYAGYPTSRSCVTSTTAPWTTLRTSIGGTDLKQFVNWGWQVYYAAVQIHQDRRTHCYFFSIALDFICIITAAMALIDSTIDMASAMEMGQIDCHQSVDEKDLLRSPNLATSPTTLSSPTTLRSADTETTLLTSRNNCNNGARESTLSGSLL